MTDVPSRYLLARFWEGGMSSKSSRGPGQSAVDRVADRLESVYGNIVTAMQNESPYSDEVKYKVKQIINEFADFKADEYSKG